VFLHPHRNVLVLALMTFALGAFGVVAPSSASEAGDMGEDPRGVFVRRKGKERFRFTEWTSEEMLVRIFENLRTWQGGELHFAPGTYTFERGIDISGIPDLTISGSPAVVLQFADGPKVTPLMLEAAKEGDTTLRVDSTEGLKEGWWYELYAPDLDATRVLEFKIVSIDGQLVHMKNPVSFMPHVSEIPAKTRVFSQINMFRIRKCPRFKLANVTVDGRTRGPVRGHTTYCGVYANGDYHVGERPRTSGFTVTGCTFKNLQGRGFCAYGLGGILIEGNVFQDIRAQAIEIDHFSSGHVINNLVDGAEIGVLLNDAFESLVEGNVLRGCGTGVGFLRIFPQEWVNTGNVVRDNHVGPGCRKGVEFIDRVFDGLAGNTVQGMRFVDLPEERQIIGHEGNTVQVR
jgi:hypothetical protein